ncbi:hypothetical protein AAY80_085 [Stenotrophomonas phage vB_SmaS-DLP_6]|nr:hypothetical protein AAY80_085 [Stenotrophomonas phage vB_SmaS-DLP_6]
MSNSTKQLKEWFKDQLDAPVVPELLSFFVYTEVGKATAEYAMKKIAPKELKLLKDYVFVNYTNGVRIPIFTIPPKAEDVDSNEA